MQHTAVSLLVCRARRNFERIGEALKPFNIPGFSGDDGLNCPQLGGGEIFGLTGRPSSAVTRPTYDMMASNCYSAGQGRIFGCLGGRVRGGGNGDAGIFGRTDLNSDTLFFSNLWFGKCPY